MVELSLSRVNTAIKIDLYTLTVVNLLLSLQILVAIAYTVLTGITVPGFRYAIIPFIWLNVAAWAVLRAAPTTRGIKHRAAAFGSAAIYFLLILYLSGLLRPGSTALEQVTGAAGFGITWRSLGWGPTLLYSGEWVSLVLIPYQVIGYLALAYLLYVAVLDITNSAFGGIIGLAPCPGCAAPVFTSMIAGIAGTSSAFVLLITYQYELATVLFVTAIVLLSRR